MNLYKRVALMAFILAAVSLASGSTTLADTISISNNNSGSYRSTGFHDSSNTNYIVGGTNSFNRNFFTFHLSGLTGIVTGAQLQLYTYTVQGNGTYRIYDVSTPESQLSADHLSGDVAGQAIHTDLGTGLSYGSISLSPADTESLIIINLNANAIAALQAGGTFSIGGDFDGNSAFGSSGFDLRNQLIITTRNSPTPEPATAVLLSTGFAGVVVHLRKRRKAS